MISKSFRHKTALTSLAALVVFLPMSACDLAKNQMKMDRSSNKEFQDFRDALAPRELEQSPSDNASVPDLAPYVVDDTVNAKARPLVSLSINQSIPLREALFELAKQADYDVELDPRISGSIIFTARNKPFDEVIDRICEISGLRYKFDGDTLRIEVDTPYSKNYKIDYLNFVRKNDSSINTDVSISASGDAKASGGSNFGVQSSSESNFWAELDTNLKQILASNTSSGYLKTDQDPQLSLTTVSPSLPPSAPVPPVDAAALSETAPQAGTEDVISTPQMVPQQTAEVAAGALPTSTTTVAPPATTATVAPPTTATATPVAAPTTTPAPADTTTAAPKPAAVGTGANTATPSQQPVLKVESLPTSVSGNASGGNAVQFTPAYSINKQAGIVSVYANQRLHKQIEGYLSALRKSMTAQVLIEAKVLEVSLNDQFSSGINWNLVRGIGDFQLTSSALTNPGLLTATSAPPVQFGFAGSDLSAFVSALSRFGTVHALASPRLSVLNNQSAVLSVARNQVYFEIKATVTPATDTSRAQVTYDTNAKTVPEGVIINVMPSIDLQDRMVSMQVRPTITKIVDWVNDPAIGLNGGSGTSKIPVVNVQETDSVLNMKDKQMMVMGGLLQDSSSVTQEGVPIAAEVPLFGNLFKNHQDVVSKKELVVFIKATILDDASQSVHQTDKDVYRLFGQDRRPSKL